jgi:hypothetical protein
LQAELTKILANLNRKSRVNLSLELSHRLSDGPTRLNSSLTRKIRKSLLFIADGTAINTVPGDRQTIIPSPQVCVEMGYALQAKAPEQILLVQMERADMPGQYPFDLPSANRLTFTTEADLAKQLPGLLESSLSRFNLWI